MATHPDFEFAAEKYDRHGKLRWRFTKGERPMLPGQPGEVAFYETYVRLCHGLQIDTSNLPKPVVVKLPAPQQQLTTINADDGTLDACWALLRQTRGWRRMALNTQKTYSDLYEGGRVDRGGRPGMLNLLTKEQKHRIGNGRVADLTRKACKHILATFADTPYREAQALQALRLLIRAGIDEGEWIDVDPTAGLVVELPQDSEGHETWQAEHFEAYERRWAPGTRQRIAYALALWLGDRCSDVARLDWSMFKPKVIMVDEDIRTVEGFHFQQFKGRKIKKGRMEFLPMSSMLGRELQYVTDRTGPVLKNHWGRKYTDGSLSSAFIKWSRDAGIQAGYSMHGLRKALAVKLAEAGATESEMMAVGGWLTAEQVRIYTEKVNRDRQSVKAFDRLEAVDARRRRTALRVVR